MYYYSSWIYRATLPELDVPFLMLIHHPPKVTKIVLLKEARIQKEFQVKLLRNRPTYDKDMMLYYIVVLLNVRTQIT